MIKNKTGSVPHIHDLKELEDKYARLYPDPSYKLDHPFDFSDYCTSELNPDEDDLYAAHVSKFKPRFIDQHLRYPVTKGQVDIHLISMVQNSTKSKLR